MSLPAEEERDRDATGKPRNARMRDDLGRPLPRVDGGAAAADEPALPPVEALRRAQRLLDTGRPFRAHEVLEAVWKKTRGPERELWRGLAQIAVGITHVLRGNDAGSRALLERGADSLASFASTTPHGIDVDGILGWVREAAGDAARAAVPPRLIADDHQAANERERARGDEPAEPYEDGA